MDRRRTGPGCGGSPWLAHLIRWVFHLLHVPPDHVLGILACREIMGQRVSGGVGAGLWGAAGRRARRVSREQAESGACWVLRALRLCLGVGRCHTEPTFLEVFFLGLAAHARYARHRLHVALAYRRRVQDGFGSSCQAHWQPGCTQQDPGHPWGLVGGKGVVMRVETSHALPSSLGRWGR